MSFGVMHVKPLLDLTLQRVLVRRQDASWHAQAQVGPIPKEVIVSWRVEGFVEKWDVTQYPGIMY